MENEIKIIYERTRKRYRHENSEKGEGRRLKKKMRKKENEEFKKNQKVKLQRREGTKIHAKTNQKN